MPSEPANGDSTQPLIRMGNGPKKWDVFALMADLKWENSIPDNVYFFAVGRAPAQTPLFGPGGKRFSCVPLHPFLAYVP